MAKTATIMPTHALEAPRETVLSREFQQLLNSLTDFIVAERDLEDVSNSQDPAYADWFREAEVAQDRLIDTLRHVHALPFDLPEDRPLQKMTMLIDAVLAHEEPGGARRLLRQMHIAFFTTFQVPGIGATALHRNAQLLNARTLVTAMVALPLFDSASIETQDVSPDDALTLTF